MRFPADGPRLFPQAQSVPAVETRELNKCWPFRAQPRFRDGMKGARADSSPGNGGRRLISGLCPQLERLRELRAGTIWGVSDEFFKARTSSAPAVVLQVLSHAQESHCRRPCRRCCGQQRGAKSVNMTRHSFRIGLMRKTLPRSDVVWSWSQTTHQLEKECEVFVVRSGRFWWRGFAIVEGVVCGGRERRPGFAPLARLGSTRIRRFRRGTPPRFI